MDPISSDKVLIISSAYCLVAFSKLSFLRISETTKINLSIDKLHISPWYYVNSIMLSMAARPLSSSFLNTSTTTSNNEPIIS